MFSLMLKTLRGRNLVPAMSETERAALEAGDVWIEGELFSGRPDFRRALAEPYPELTAEERAFLDGPVEEVCARTDREEIRRTRRLPPEVWALLRRHRFFGLGFPKRYGGHEFSALAQSTVYGKLATRSLALSSVVLIPNSVGPGELLLEVGTEEQRERYLPRLVRGDEIPCFALTEPTAGSDAASLTSRGELFRAPDGELRIRLDWEKRYITLAPVATLLGLAFRLYDPEELLGRGTDVGITCALVPTSLEGVEIGRYHDPMGIPFPNGPTTGRGVVVPAGAIIGGVEYAGRGWRMLMEAADILTRTLIVFSQGAMRCHPHVHRLLESVRQDDLGTFRRALFAEAWHFARNACRALLLGLSRRGGRGTGGRGLRGVVRCAAATP